MTTNITLISDISDVTLENETELDFMDLSLDLDVRLKLLLDANPEEMADNIKRLADMFTFSKTTRLKEYLIGILKEKNIPLMLRMDVIDSFTGYLDKFSKDREKKVRDQGYHLLHDLCKELSFDYPTPLRVNCLKRLLGYNDEFTETAFQGLKLVTNEQSIECPYRYTVILDLEKVKDCPPDVMKRLLLNFTNQNFNFTYYRILACQYLLQNLPLSSKESNGCQRILLQFAEDECLDYNLRADAADTLHSLGTRRMKDKAINIINTLGNAYGEARTFAQNAQNVHTKAVEESVESVIKQLLEQTYTTKEREGVDYFYIRIRITDKLDEVREEHTKTEGVCCKYCAKSDTEEYCSEQCKVLGVREDDIIASLNRINMDRLLYSKYNQTLKNLLVQVWLVMKEDEEMVGRLLQELEEMSGTCTSGFASRLVNVLSGFQGFNLSMSWEQQIIDNIFGRLNARIRKIPILYEEVKSLYELKTDLYLDKNFKFDTTSSLAIPSNLDISKSNGVSLEVEAKKKRRIELIDEYKTSSTPEEIREWFQERVLEEIALPSSDYQRRRCFLKFFRDQFLSIREELYPEFKEYISDIDFDLYTSKAVIVYTG